MLLKLCILEIGIKLCVTKSVYIVCLFVTQAEMMH